MKAISPWAVAAGRTFVRMDPHVLYQRSLGKFTFSVHATIDSLWTLVKGPHNAKMIFRAAFCPGAQLQVLTSTETPEGINFQLSTSIGDVTVVITLLEEGFPILRYKSDLTPHLPLLIPFWPRDIVIPGEDGSFDDHTGKLHVKQVGTRSGLLYMTWDKPQAGTALYLQNLTALADYNQLTGTSARELVGGDWPEMGFTLPAMNDKPLPAGQTVTISDAFVVFDPETASNESVLIRQFLNMLAAAYLQLPRPATVYKNWHEILEKGLQDLIHNHGCWTQVQGKQYINAYLCDYNTPPEIMVQLAVLLPLMDYVEWGGHDLPVMKKIRETFPAFFNPELQTLMRWLPAAEHRLEGEEEQKEPLTMDSWYLHHPLLNLSRLALKGDTDAGKLFLDSLKYAIHVAQHFNYKWPVFYKMDTLEVIKAETLPGKGGEKDVAGLYAHIMLQAWELTGSEQYLAEARTAADTLMGLGFELFYQANNTAFAAGALLRLWKITKEQRYLELSYTCLANIFRNVQLWDCNYGYGNSYPTFFALFPLNDAPYTAPYEEQEVFCAFHDYLKHAEGTRILPSVTLLISEYIRYLVDRACFYYPPMLPKEALSTDIKTGELDDQLWVALEDLHDGWEKSGAVGQEVYGAGNAFGILPRHYFHVSDATFKIYVDYPVVNFSSPGDRCLSFDVKGHERISCRLVIVKITSEPLPDFRFELQSNHVDLSGCTLSGGHRAYTITGNQHVVIGW